MEKFDLTEALMEAEVKSLSESIAEATLENMPEILKRLAEVKSETERAILIEALSKQLNIGKREIFRDVKKYSLNPEIRKKTSLTSLMPPTKDLIEVIKTKDGLKYYTLNHDFKDFLEVDDVIYKLPQQANLVIFPTESFLNFTCEDNDTIFNEIDSYIYDHLDLQEDFGYKILTLWVLHTWLIDRFNTSPIIHFLGPYASGKSRGGDVLSVLARRGLSTVNLTGAPIFRVGALYQPTFNIDEVKLIGKNRDRDIQELLNARFQRGRKVIRINPDKTGLDSILEFDVFGATVLCGLDELPETPRSRSIVFIMEQNVRPVSKSLDLKRADILRDKLCAFRARYIEEKMPVVEGFVRDGRLSDAIEPLHQILKLVKPNIEMDFWEFFKGIERERKEDMFDSFDAEVVRALLECGDQVSQGKILTSAVAEKFNESKTDSEKIGLRTIGRVLSRLGLKKTRTTGGIHARYWDKNKIARLCRKFDIADERDVSDVNDVKNLIKGGTENNFNIEGFPFEDVKKLKTLVVDTDEDMHTLKSQGIQEPIYTKHEIRELRKLDKEGLKEIHKVKEVFEFSKVEEVKTKENHEC